VVTAYKPSDFGLPKYLDEKADAYHRLPGLGISNIEGFGSGYPSITDRGTTAELKAQMTTIRGSHSFKYGYGERRYWFTQAGVGNSSGNFSFDNTYMRATDNTTTASGFGLGWAAFMMGVPSGISINTPDTGYWSTRFRTAYFQDDWRLTGKLRVTL